MKPEREMTYQEFKEYFYESKYYKSRQNKFVRTLSKLRVVVWKFEWKRGNWKYFRRFNPYNPLSYPTIILMYVAVVFYSMWQGLKSTWGGIKAAIEDGNPFRWLG